MRFEIFFIHSGTTMTMHDTFMDESLFTLFILFVIFSFFGTIFANL